MRPQHMRILLTKDVKLITELKRAPEERRRKLDLIRARRHKLVVSIATPGPDNHLRKGAELDQAQAGKFRSATQREVHIDIVGSSRPELDAPRWVRNRLRLQLGKARDFAARCGKAVIRSAFGCKGLKSGCRPLETARKGNRRKEGGYRRDVCAGRFSARTSITGQHCRGETTTA